MSGVKNEDVNEDVDKNVRMSDSEDGATIENKVEIKQVTRDHSLTFMPGDGEFPGDDFVVFEDHRFAGDGGERPGLARQIEPEPDRKHQEQGRPGED